MNKYDNDDYEEQQGCFIVILIITVIVFAILLAPIIKDIIININN